jgi:3-hydroxybutyryl-CoA dehydrogenase
MARADITRVGIAGSGVMGVGIARVAAATGLPVTLLKVTRGDTGAVRERLVSLCDREVKKGTLSQSTRDDVLDHVRVTHAIEDLADCDLVLESVIEDLGQKQRLLRDLGAIATARALLASNTSSLPIAELALASGRPADFAGLHFFNPAPAMRLVEVVPAPATSAHAMERARAFCVRLGKVPVVVADHSGFVVNRLLVPYLLDSIRLLEAGVADMTGIDQAMQLGAGQPMGPFTLADFIGLDVLEAMAANLLVELGEPRFVAPALLERLVRAGALGRKSRLGFYDYSTTPPRPNPNVPPARSGQSESHA